MDDAVTHTYAILEVSPATYEEIREKLKAAGCVLAFDRDSEGEMIDMHGIALRVRSQVGDGE